MEIKDIIRKRREELNLTYEELGKLVGVGKSTVRKWETGMIENMRRDSIVALAKALNLSPAVIMGWDIDTPTNILTSKKLSEKEEKLLSTFNELNELGKNEAIKRIDELTEINKYIKKDHNLSDAKIHLMPVAAHNDFADDPEQQKLMKEDLDEL